jgi:hypothetical protein
MWTLKIQESLLAVNRIAFLKIPQLLLLLIFMEQIMEAIKLVEVAKASTISQAIVLIWIS